MSATRIALNWVVAGSLVLVTFGLRASTGRAVVVDVYSVLQTTRSSVNQYGMHFNEYGNFMGRDWSQSGSVAHRARLTDSQAAGTVWKFTHIRCGVSAQAGILSGGVFYPYVGEVVH